MRWQESTRARRRGWDSTWQPQRQIEQALAVQAFSSLDGVRVSLRPALGELSELVILRIHSVCFLSLAGICFTVASVVLRFICPLEMTKYLAFSLWIDFC
jgi:hypothetical protein